MRKLSLAFALIAVVLVSFFGCTAPYAQRLASGDSVSDEHGHNADLDLLLKNGNAQEIFDVLVRTPNDKIASEIVYFLRDPSKFPDSDFLREHQRDLVNKRGKFDAAITFLCRGDRRGFLLLAELFAEIEAKPGDILTREKELEGLRYLLIDATGIIFENSQQFRDWIRDVLPTLRFDTSQRTPMEGLPRLVPFPAHP